MSITAYFIGGSQDLTKRVLAVDQPKQEVVYFRDVRIDDLIDGAGLIRVMPEKEVYRLLGPAYPNQPIFVYSFAGTTG